MYICTYVDMYVYYCVYVHVQRVETVLKSRCSCRAGNHLDVSNCEKMRRIGAEGAMAHLFVCVQWEPSFDMYYRFPMISMTNRIAFEVCIYFSLITPNTNVVL